MHIEISEKYLCKINQLHNEKVALNKEKIENLGFIDVDDHGFIFFKDFNFVPKPNHPSGMVYGMKAIGENLNEFLHQIPLYINQNSSLACCWVGNIIKWMELGFVDDYKPKHLQETIEKYHIIQSGCGGMNHLCPDLTIGLSLGWGGILKKIRYYRDFLNPDNKDFYDGEELLVLGIQEWIKRHAHFANELAASELAKTEKNEELIHNYKEIASVNEWLIDNPPRNFREACQFLAHFQSIDRTYFVGGALGQLDELLRPYYEQDIACGKLTDEEAIWNVASLLFNDTHYSQIGGLIPDGSREVTSKMSFIILDAMHYLKIPANIAIRIHDKANKDLIKKSVEYIIEDGSGVDYSCSVGCEEGFVKNGFPKELARMRIKTGCNWVALPGVEYPLQDVTRVSFAEAFVHAMNDMKIDGSEKIDYLWKQFEFHLKNMIDCIKDGYDWHYENVSKNTPEIVLNLFMHGPIERGLNCAEGGVDITHYNIDGIGLATVADSFAAIEERIIQEKKLSFTQLFEILDHNYEGYEDIRLMLKNIKRFGNPNSRAQYWAERIRDFFVTYCRNTPTPKNHIRIIPGMFSHGDVYLYGKELPATPNGRKTGDPISHSNEPDPGFANGVNSYSWTLKANAVAKVQPGFGNSAPLHLDIDKGLIQSAGGVDAILALLHTHNQMGGTLINLNCITKEQLLKAHENPEDYPDLIVRVTGYSAFFASLSKEYRQQIIDRFL